MRSEALWPRTILSQWLSEKWQTYSAETPSSSCSTSWSQTSTWWDSQQWDDHSSPMARMAARRMAGSTMVGRRVKANTDGEDTNTCVRKLIRTVILFCSVVVQFVRVSLLQLVLLSLQVVATAVHATVSVHRTPHQTSCMHAPSHANTCGSRSLSARQKSSHQLLSCLSLASQTLTYLLSAHLHRSRLRPQRPR